KPRAGPGIGQQHGGVEHIGPDGSFGHLALLEAAQAHAAPHEHFGGHCGTGTGAGPLVIETIGTARIAEQVASHRETTLLSPSASRRAGAPWLTRHAYRLSAGSSASPHAVMRSAITWRSCCGPKMPASAICETLSAYASMSAPTNCSSAARRAIASTVSSPL